MLGLCLVDTDREVRAHCLAVEPRHRNTAIPHHYTVFFLPWVNHHLLGAIKRIRKIEKIRGSRRTRRRRLIKLAHASLIAYPTSHFSLRHRSKTGDLDFCDALATCVLNGLCPTSTKPAIAHVSEGREKEQRKFCALVS